MAEDLRVYTSPAPSHVLGPGHQAMCFDSWGKYNRVQMVPREDGGSLSSASALYGKPYVFIDDVFADFLASGQEVCVITNSDIELRDPGGILDRYIQQAKTSVVLSNRQDHNGDYIPHLYPHGFDVFILNRAFVESLPPTLFCLGQTWWDYWLPYRAIKQGVPLTLIKEPIFWHHRHTQQHNGKQWERMTEHFTWIEEYRKNKSASQVTSEVYQLIRRHAK
jgi:hypothetical protein